MERALDAPFGLPAELDTFKWLRDELRSSRVNHTPYLVVYASDLGGADGLTRRTYRSLVQELQL